MPPTLTVPGLSNLNLKVGQPLEAKVINAMITTTQNAISLKIGNQIITVQSSESLNLQPGQTLVMQVTKVTPTLELKLLSPLPSVNSQPIVLTASPQAEPLRQQLQAKIIGVFGNQIQLQIIPDASANLQQKPAIINIDRASMLVQTSISVGQQVVLDVNPTDKSNKYRLMDSVDNGIEEKLATLFKQLLPKQASSIPLLNQLSKDLPQLIANETTPQSLKNAALEILQNLPQKEELFDSHRLAKLINNSGVFMEAKLPLLIKNGVLADGLKEAVINLLQKLPQQLTSKAIPVDSKVKPTDTLAETLLKTDFKANLGKLLQVLDQDISNKNGFILSDTELDVLKNMQQKVENSVAKIVLEQLASLPKDDSPKQLWHCAIAFLDGEKAQTAQLEIQMDKEKKLSTEDNNWSVTISITPPGLGPIHCVVACRDKLISTYFKAPHAETSNLIRDNLEHLKTQFEACGLKVGPMHANEGDLQKNIEPSQQTQGQKLFDDRA